MQKKELRKHYLSQRMALSTTDRSHRSELICEKLASFCKDQTGFSQLCLFFSVRNEPTVEKLVHVLGGTFTFALPVVSEAGGMVFLRWDQNTSLRRNKFDICEPDPATSEEIKIDSKTIVLVPAIAIDRKGHRLGFGGGFYDRFLKEHKDSMTVGVVYSDFFVKELPSDEWDISVDWICTENGAVRVQTVIFPSS